MQLTGNVKRTDPGCVTITLAILVCVLETVQTVFVCKCFEQCHWLHL